MQGFQIHEVLLFNFGRMEMAYDYGGDGLLEIPAHY